MGRWAMVAVAVAAGAAAAAGVGCGAHHGSSGAAAGASQPATHSCAPPAAAPAGQGQTAFAAPPAVGVVARCPVSGETFKVAESTVRAEHQGRHFAFCCPGCKSRFDADPARYAK